MENYLERELDKLEQIFAYDEITHLMVYLLWFKGRKHSIHWHERDARVEADRLWHKYPIRPEQLAIHLTPISMINLDPKQK